MFETTLCSSLLSVWHEPPTQAAAQYHIIQFGRTLDNTYTSLIFRLVFITTLEQRKKFCSSPCIRVTTGKKKYCWKTLWSEGSSAAPVVEYAQRNTSRVASFAWVDFSNCSVTSTDMRLSNIGIRTRASTKLKLKPSFTGGFITLVKIFKTYVWRGDSRYFIVL